MPQLSLNDAQPPAKKQGLNDEPEPNERAVEILSMNIGNDIPVLPNDIMRMIFREFSDKERVPIGTSCKRFRAIDFDVGRRTFDEIYISLSKSDQHIFGVRNNFPVTPGYGVVQQRSVEDWWSDHNKYLFKRAKTTKLSIIAKDETTAPQIASMVKTISFENLYLSFQVSMDFSEIMNTVIQNRNLDHANIYVLWYCYISPTSAERLRETLLNLPRTDKVLLKQINCFSMKDIWINDANLLHLTSHTNTLELDEVDNECTVQAILLVFEECCKSTMASKTVSFETEKAVADSLFSTTHPPEFEVIDRPSYRRLIHASSGTVLQENARRCQGWNMLSTGQSEIVTVERSSIIIRKQKIVR